MRITIQAMVEGADGEASRAETISTVERTADGVPASGLGLFLRETHALLRHRFSTQGELALADAMQQLNAREGDRRSREPLEAEHRGSALLYDPVIVLDQVVQVFR